MNTTNKIENTGISCFAGDESLLKMAGKIFQDSSKSLISGMCLYRCTVKSVAKWWQIKAQLCCSTPDSEPKEHINHVLSHRITLTVSKTTNIVECKDGLIDHSSGDWGVYHWTQNDSDCFAYYLHHFPVILEFSPHRDCLYLYYGSHKSELATMVWRFINIESDVEMLISKLECSQALQPALLSLV